MAIQGLNNIQINPIGKGGRDPSNGSGKGIDSGFAGKLDKILGSQDSANTSEVSKPLSIKFSNHAVERMRSRGIHFSPETLQRIDSAVARAEGKGAKETLIMAEDSAMIVNIENKTVVTVMDKSMLKENIFTNIDAAAIV